MSWLRSLQGQILLAIAAALLIAQGLSAWLIWREVHQRHVATLVNGTVMRMLGDRALMPNPDHTGPDHTGPDHAGPDHAGPDHEGHGGHEGGRDLLPPPPPPLDDRLRLPRPLHVRIDAASPEQPGDRHLGEVETQLHEVLESQSEQTGPLLVVERDPERDPLLRPVLPALRARFRLPGDGALPRLVVASERQADGSWLTVRSFMPASETQLLLGLLRQTILTYIVLVGVVGLILRRITRPLSALTRRLESFAADPGVLDQLEPQGPADIQRLIIAHNAMEARISALLDEKDVMLGAIGHDLKTPLAALRVRIEAVEDDVERGRMAATIEDINRSLDDILSLARVGRPSDPIEATEMSALVADIIGEYEDMGDNVTLGDAERMVAPVRATWLRRALRNLVSNALRYGHCARVTLRREGREAVLIVEDDGPGIPEGDIARMMEPFTRLDPSRNSATGGTGLGLTLARAIADQHGGSLILANRLEQGRLEQGRLEQGRLEKGRIVGLCATLRVPLA
ncbi:histidine kinase [Novosphingobium sp. Fuku2-ISO-50]|nr:histidine kinase [Novosphingobium sp. Fuku2-ISO-50]